MPAAAALIDWLKRQRARPRPIRLILALGFILLVFAARLARDGAPHGGYVLFLPAVALVALVLGLLPGLAAACLATLLAIRWLIDPVGSFTIGRWEDVGVVLLFLISTTVTSGTVEALWILAQEEG